MKTDDAPETRIAIAAPVELDAVSPPELLAQIRPEWRARNLIERTRRLLPIDPSSACQRLLNAAIHDLRDKIITAGVDIAAEAATRYRLPRVADAEDIDQNYSVNHVIDLAYRMGLLSRPEWRRIRRCYEIRRDLEHEDDEYEAEIEDVLYIFRSCIQIVLSRDPIQLIRVDDVKDFISAQTTVTPSPELLREFSVAPETRQREIVELLVQTALDSGKADIIRQNAFQLLRDLRSSVKRQAQIDVATHLQERAKKTKRLDLIVAQVANAAGVLPYIKQSLVSDLFGWITGRLNDVTPSWRAHKHHSKPLEDFEDIGGFLTCPEAHRTPILRWMVLCYIGEPGGYGMGVNRSVFYSNAAAPKIEKLVSACRSRVELDWDAIDNDRLVQEAISKKAIARRLETLRDLTATP